MVGFLKSFVHHFNKVGFMGYRLRVGGELGSSRTRPYRWGRAMHGDLTHGSCATIQRLSCHVAPIISNSMMDLIKDI